MYLVEFRTCSFKQNVQVLASGKREGNMMQHVGENSLAHSSSRCEPLTCRLSKARPLQCSNAGDLLSSSSHGGIGTQLLVFMAGQLRWNGL